MVLSAGDGFSQESAGASFDVPFIETSEVPVSASAAPRRSMVAKMEQARSKGDVAEPEKVVPEAALGEVEKKAEPAVPVAPPTAVSAAPVQSAAPLMGPESPAAVASPNSENGASMDVPVFSELLNTSEVAAPAWGAGSEVKVPKERRSLGSLVSSSNQSQVASQPHVHQVVVVDSPEEGTQEGEVPTWSDGYFPTLDDKIYLGDRETMRGAFRNQIGPDFRSQVAAGMVGVPYDEEPDSFYDRNAFFYGPLDSFLGYMRPEYGGNVYEFEHLNGAFTSFDARWPYFTTTLDPDKAHFKAGPLYLDVLSIGAGVVWSDYDGPRQFEPGEEDGWLGYTSMNLRAYLRLTERFFISASGRIIYLPGVNEVGFRVGAGDGGLGAHVKFGYDFEVGNWDVFVYDLFRAFHYANLYSSADAEAIESAGRYRFGIADAVDRTDEFFNHDAGGFSNIVGIKAASPFGSNWRKEVEADHTDYWNGYDFSQHNRRDHLGAMVGYTGDRIPFSPYARYDVDSFDGFDSHFHRVYGGIRGRISENVVMTGGAGYFWSMDRNPDHDSILWDLGLVHRINSRARHSIHGGQNFFTNDLIAEYTLAEYLRYNFAYSFSTRLRGDLFAQWSTHEGVSSFGGGSQEQYGAGVSYFPWDYTHLRASIYQQRSHRSYTDDVDQRLVIKAESNHRLWSRTTLELFYKFEDAERFDEHMTGAEIQRHF
ncbi:MAG: hypothetical protein JNK37_01620 [Verrucomicrobiales bacterium]|nr:hypothetical protein [Verrucomicrobiales bacterium]